jgi:hypothetical protein
MSEENKPAEPKQEKAQPPAESPKKPLGPQNKLFQGTREGPRRKAED